MFDHIKAFQRKLQLLCRHLSAGNLAHFPSLREVNLVQQKLSEYATLVSNLDLEFEMRFLDFRKNSGDMELFSQPFSTSVDCVPDHIQMELIEFQCDSELRNKFMSLKLKDLYTHVSPERYPNIRKHAQVMLSLFGSTYICEQTFSVMNLNKTRLRSNLTDLHLQDVLTLSVSQLQPDIERLVKAKDQLHVSH
uniref:general transcription factor II-I repeat domain-containing protein 2B-like n=1 Tax=Monopterus albus TaxID=43700 RepID=UPI0009B2E8A1|nr:general transcription factor II-I repeat domain-containing protein 2B-like [Monopterus albus]